MHVYVTLEAMTSLCELITYKKKSDSTQSYYMTKYLHSFYV